MLIPDLCQQSIFYVTENNPDKFGIGPKSASGFLRRARTSIGCRWSWRTSASSCRTVAICPSGRAVKVDFSFKAKSWVRIPAGQIITLHPIKLVRVKSSCMQLWAKLDCKESSVAVRAVRQCGSARAGTVTACLYLKDVFQPRMWPFCKKNLSGENEMSALPQLWVKYCNKQCNSVILQLPDLHFPFISFILPFVELTQRFTKTKLELWK